MDGVGWDVVTLDSCAASSSFPLYLVGHQALQTPSRGGDVEGGREFGLQKV
jgi:hypothetical protein